MVEESFFIDSVNILMEVNWTVAGDYLHDVFNSIQYLFLQLQNSVLFKVVLWFMHSVGENRYISVTGIWMSYQMITDQQIEATFRSAIHAKIDHSEKIYIVQNLIASLFIVNYYWKHSAFALNCYT